MKYARLGPDHHCPRRVVAALVDTPDGWYADSGCTYCGSLSGDAFMARVEAGDVELGPTDKSYKVYLRNRGGAPFLQTYRNCPMGGECKGPFVCDHWVTVPTEQAKFYFQHLSDAQRSRFVELANAQHLHLGYPGHFYTLPYFTQYAT